MTIGDLKILYKDVKFGFTFFSMAIIITIVFLIMLQAVLIWVRIPVSLIVSGFISLLLIGLADECGKFDTYRIIEQVKRCPADEKWIALSMDSYKNCLQRDREAEKKRLIDEGKPHRRIKVTGSIYQKAKILGIGILVVNSNEKV